MDAIQSRQATLETVKKLKEETFRLTGKNQ